MIYEKHQIIKRIRDLGMREQPFMLVGVRSKDNLPNVFDDRMYLVSNSNFASFNCTTEPGNNWLKTLMNPKGAAVLKPGSYKFKFGTHHNDYECLVQAEEVVVYRDNDLDSIAEEQGIEDRGWFGIHIHRANATGTSKLVDKWSAGCQVIADYRDFNFLMKICKNSGLQEFQYYLLKEW